MAVKNRTEATTEVNTKIVPTVTNVTHRDLLNNDIINSIVFRKDIIASETPAGGNVTIDYSDKDTATVTITANLSVSFTNIENGDVKYLHITKNATNTISFAGAIDVIQNRDIINKTLTSVIYRISDKNGIIYVEGIYAPASTTFATLTLESNWSGSAKYRVNNFSGKTEVELNLMYDSSGVLLATLPAAARPDRDIKFTMCEGADLSANIAEGVITGTTGVINIYKATVTTTSNYIVYFEFYNTLP